MKISTIDDLNRIYLNSENMIFDFRLTMFPSKSKISKLGTKYKKGIEIFLLMYLKGIKDEGFVKVGRGISVRGLDRMIKQELVIRAEDS